MVNIEKYRSGLDWFLTGNYGLKMFICGAMFSLCFAPTFFFPALLCLSVLAYYIKHAINAKSMLLGSFMWGCGSNLIGLYWIAIAPTVYGSELIHIAILSLIGIPILMSAPIVIASWISWRFRGYRDFYFIFVVLWVFLEWVRSFVFTGFPWNLTAYSVANYLSFLQIVNITGVYGLSFVISYISVLWLTVFDDKEKIKQNVIVYAVTSLFLIISIMGYGYIRLNNNPTTYSDIKIRLVQPSIDQGIKWDDSLVVPHLKKHMQLTHLPFNIDGIKSSPDLVVWPEAAITKPINDHSAHLFLGRLSDNAVLLAGGIDLEQEEQSEIKIYVTMYALGDNKIIAKYHKSHLVPFGEYVPFKQYLPMNKITDGLMDYSSGGKDNIITLDKLNLRVRPLICYEAIFPEEVGGSNSKYDVIVNATNDSWYGNSSGPYQHFYTTRLRAIEQAVPLLRVASNGISAIIDPLGRVIKSSKLDDVSVVDGLLPQKLIQSSIYSQLGNTLAVLLVIFMYSFRNIIKKALMK